MANDVAFLHGDAILNGTPSNVDQLDGDDSDDSTKVDLLGADARIEEVTAESGERHSGVTNDDGEMRGSSDVLNTNLASGTTGFDTASPIKVLPPADHSI